MQRIRSLALPAAICVATAGACHDGPLAPRPVVMPDAIITGTDGSTTMPQILSHAEQFYFGSHTQTSSVPSGVNADMTFIGDDGEIDLASVTVTPDSGAAPYVTSGRISLGPGDIVSCLDVTLGGCSNRHLAGVMILSGAPDCNARASGTIAYYAAVVRTTLGFAWGPISTTTGLTTVSTSAPFTATAPRCGSTATTSDGQQSTDSTTTTPGTGTVGPAPAPTGPNVPAPPPPTQPPTSGAGGGFYCQQTDLYSVYGGTRTLISTVIDCYPDT